MTAQTNTKRNQKRMQILRFAQDDSVLTFSAACEVQLPLLKQGASTFAEATADRPTFAEAAADRPTEMLSANGSYELAGGLQR